MNLFIEESKFLRNIKVWEKEKKKIKV